MKTKRHYTTSRFWDYLTERGLTIQAFAPMVGYHPETVYQFKSGTDPITARFVLIACAVLGIREGDFFSPTDSTNVENLANIRESEAVA